MFIGVPLFKHWQPSAANAPLAGGLVYLDQYRHRIEIKPLEALYGEGFLVSMDRNGIGNGAWMAADK